MDGAKPLLVRVTKSGLAQSKGGWRQTEVGGSSGLSCVLKHRQGIFEYAQTPFVHVSKVLKWSPDKLYRRTISLERTMFVIVCSIRSNENTRSVDWKLRVGPELVTKHCVKWRCVLRDGKHCFSSSEGV